MTAPDRYAEKVRHAELALAYRLAEWGVKDADEKAAAFIADLLRQGWRGWAPVVALPPRPTEVALPPTDLIAETRAVLHAAATRHTEPEERTDGDG